MWSMPRSFRSCTDRCTTQHLSYPSPHEVLQHRLRRRHNYSTSSISSMTASSSSIRHWSVAYNHQSQPSPTNTVQPATSQSNDGYRDLLKWTENILHPIRTPIGSIERSLWQDVFIAIQVWLGYKPSLSVEQLFESIKISDDPSDAVMILATGSHSYHDMSN